MHIYIQKENKEAIEKIKKYLEETNLSYEELISVSCDHVKLDVPLGDQMTGFISMTLGASSSGGF